MKKRSVQQQIELNRALSNLASSLTNCSSAQIKDPLMAVLLLAFSNGLRTHQSIVLLVENNLGEDAYKLARSLYEITVNLKYILKDAPSTRAEQYLSYIPVEKLKLYRCLTTGNGENKKIFDDAEAEQKEGYTTIQEITKREQEVKERFPVFNEKKGWAGMKIAQLANEVNEKTSYDSRYRLSSCFVHFNPLIYDSYIKVEDQKISMRGSNDQTNLLDPLLIGYAEFQWIIETCNKHNLFDLKSRLDELNEKYVSLDNVSVKKMLNENGD